MSEFWMAFASHAFLQHAVVAGLLASVGCGVVGAFVVVKRIGFLAGGIAHAVLGGMGVAYFLGRSPTGGAVVAALIAAAVIGWLSVRGREREDTLISAVWAVGMAIGIVFISRAPGYKADLMGYLFGNILMVSREQLAWMAGVDLAILLVVGLFFKQLLAVSFDEEYARLRGVRVEVFTFLLLGLVALTVVLLVQVVGLILVIALLTLPAATALRFTQTLGPTMLGACAFGALFTLAGLGLSYGPDWPAGATIILVAAGAYGVSSMVAGSRRPTGS